MDFAGVMSTFLPVRIQTCSTLMTFGAVWFTRIF